MRVNQQRNYGWLRAIIVLSTGFTLQNQHSLAQVIPDTTLSNDNSLVNPNATIKDLPASLIEGGAERGANLFHSFREFNIGNLERVYFANPTGIERIFSRVTGNNLSNIDGVLGVLGNADLFFLNPNGIIFGQNASLDVNGSFIGSTADSLVFGDEFVFSASNPTDVPALLTVNILPGLQYGNSPGTITNLSVANGVGLQVPTNKTLGLVGGDIEVNGGVISAFGGRVELGGVGENSLVTIDSVDNGYTFNYDNVEQFQDITLNSAFVNVNGEGGGDLQVVGQNIALRQSSVINAGTFGGLSGGTLSFNGSDSIELSGGSAIVSSVRPQATGKGNNIIIDTESLVLTNGAVIFSDTDGIGNGGDVEVTAKQVKLAGFSSILVPTEGSGNAGNFTLNTDILRLTDGSQIASNTRGKGNAGQLKIDAINIELIGVGVNTFGELEPSALFAQVLSNDTGKGGNIIITTQTLKLEDQAEIGASTFGIGDAGNITINTNSLLVLNGAQLGASTFENNGNAGNVIIDSSLIRVAGRSIDGRPSRISTQTASDATGNAGNLIINTDNFFIEEGAQVDASTLSEGKGGKLTVNATNLLQLTESKEEGFLPTGLFTQTEGVGDAQDLNITTNKLIVQDGAIISSSTGSLGNAGNLNITAKEIELIGSNSENQESSGLFTASFGTGEGGKLTVTTEKLSLIDKAAIVALSRGEGLAGEVEINADSLNLDDSAITTETDAGDGGNITLEIQDLLRLRNNSQISTTAGRLEAGGDGGDITINSDLIVAFPEEDSDITANAFNGRGGNVNITTQGLFGLEFRPETTDFSDITASSQFGLDGDVTINTPDVNPAEGLISLSQNFATPPLDTSCQAQNSNNSSFINLGRGGLPESPRDIRSNQEIWEDLRSPNVENFSNKKIQSIKYNPIIEAQSWIVGENGNIVLVANIEQQNNLGNYKNSNITNSCN